MKILAIVPMPFDGTSYYRAYGVFPDLKKQFAKSGETFEVHRFYDNSSYTWPDLLPYDILFIQRPTIDAKKRIDLITYVKGMGKKVWIDFDDNMFQVPMENRTYDDMTEEVVKTMAYVLSMADLITVSTPALKTYYEGVGLKNRIEVIPNAWNFELHGFADSYNEVKPVPPPQKSKIKYLWRGSETHQGDILSSSETIAEVAVKFQEEITWTFMGYNPWFLTEHFPKQWWNLVRSDDIMKYFANIRKQGAQLMFFPLRDNVFNHSKSNIAWMEATYAGMVCVAPDWPEWQKPGVINYTSEEHLKDILSDFKPEFYKEQWQKSAEYITNFLSLDDINSQRKYLLNELIK